MDVNNNILIIIFSLLPILLYIYLVYFMVPKTFVSLDRGRRYLISGLMSPFIIFLIYFIFPNWGKTMFDDFFINYLFFTVIQIGLLEELSKYTIFHWVSLERQSRKYDLPIATIYYSIMTSLGFALTENISYLISLYNLNSLDPFITSTDLSNSMFKLSLTRSLTAVVMHMICGLIIGYFVNIYREKEKKDFIKNQIFGHNLKIKNKIYILLGIVVASLYHGIYNLNLMLPNNEYKMLYLIVIISFGLSLGYFMLKDSIRESKIIRLVKFN